MGFALINGVYVNGADLDFKVNGIQLVGLKTVNYKGGVTMNDVKGAQRVPLGVVFGHYGASGDIELELPAASSLITILTPLGAGFGGWMRTPCSISCTYGPVVGAFPPIVTDLLPTVYFKEVEASQNITGDDSLSRKFALHIVGQILFNGVASIIETGSIGAIG